MRPLGKLALSRNPSSLPTTSDAFRVSAGSWASLALAFLIAPQLIGGQPRPPEVVSTPQENGAQSSSSVPGAQRASTREDEEMQADVLMARKQYADAVPLYQKLLQQEPKSASLLNKLGIAYHQQNLLDQAKRYYERAVKADRTYANAYNNIGTIHYQRKKYSQAVRAYKKALAVQPEMAAVHSNLGYAYFMQKHYDEAMAAFHRALELDPEVFERSHRSGALVQDRSVEDRGLFNYLLAKSFAAMGNAERCAHYLRKARDEGYVNWVAAQTDPAFARVIKDPSVQELFESTPPSAAKTPPGS